ncbi:LysR family transcriptional regulator [Asaia bogorensis]|uniref:LysR family transcriptional regulator n=1 Tax=Asaia bogorensis NBRC 16594 TaxID=1231624 RepID=A0AAN4U286_9PROT|nr:LysR family transcriptional regulator [Asaia bogorensis]BAT18669.1 transcriptional regulator LysR [Asaia bogorensis NBRC 16594]GBQ75502.1 LysR family transcriptional regulator [Asaia bogorensis NBRC 16594]GEL53023.1 LysR family transcriptional regulator [Asaia bogorensis NBRC 16594]
MKRDDLVDLNAFLAVAEEQSFTRAAARLGTSQSALSHTVRRLETRLGVRLLTRTTRRVSATLAGERLLQTLVPALDSISDEIAAISELSERPSGTIRLTTSDHAARTLIWPALRRLLPGYPEIQVELAIDSGLTDIVAERFDAGVRLEETIARDMIAVPIGPPLRMAVVGAPAYFAHQAPPRQPQDLSQHQCLKLRMASSGAIYAWELEKGRRSLRVRPEGPLTFNNAPMLLEAARDGFGLACVMEDQILDDVAAGRLVRVLEDWCPPFPGYHLYYPSRRNTSAAFRLLVEALRYRA